MKSNPTFADFTARLREFIESCTHPDSAFSLQPSAFGLYNGPPQVGCYESVFNQLALDLFALQFQHNTPYRRLCEARKASPGTISDWREIPAVPTSAFKELDLTSLASHERIAVFHSSGTTAQRPSRHYHGVESLTLYEASLLPWFAKHLLPLQTLSPSDPPAKAAARRADGERVRVRGASFIILTPSPALAPHSSLVHMFETVRGKFGSAQSLYAGMVDAGGGWSLDLDLLMSAIRELTDANRPSALLGTAFNFVRLLEHLALNNFRLPLPSGSSALETGGYKGRSRSLPKAELHGLIARYLGIPAARIVCEYGMTELSSQAYDHAVVPSHPSPITHHPSPIAERFFHFPPWARARIVSPESGQEVADGETGLIQVFDLANVRSVMAVQTDDLGLRRGDGFELIGRAATAEPRGCSLMAV